MVLQFISNNWDVRDVEGAVLVKLRGRDLIGTTALLLVDDLRELLRESGKSDLYLDFGAVETLSSTVLAQLVILDRTLSAEGGHLTLFSPNDTVRRILLASHVAELLDVRAIPLPGESS